METAKQIEPTPGSVPQRNLAGRAVVAPDAFATPTIPVLAAGGSGTASKEDPTAIRPFHIPVSVDPNNVSIPVAVSVFPDETYAAPRSWTERAYPKHNHYNKLDKGGHFAAWEQPQLFSEEVHAGFKSLRDAKVAALNR